MKEYKITVWLTYDYTQSDSFTYKSDMDLTIFGSEGRINLIKEINKRYNSWYYLDIE